MIRQNRNLEEMQWHNVFPSEQDDLDHTILSDMRISFFKPNTWDELQ
jgi:hypothetical protein